MPFWKAFPCDCLLLGNITATLASQKSSPLIPGFAQSRSCKHRLTPFEDVLNALWRRSNPGSRLHQAYQGIELKPLNLLLELDHGLLPPDRSA